MSEYDREHELVDIPIIHSPPLTLDVEEKNDLQSNLGNERLFVELLMSKYTNSGEGKDFDEIHTMAFIKGYKLNLIMICLYYVLCVLTCGILLLFSRWIPRLKLILTHLPTSMYNATSVLVKSKLGGYVTPCKVKVYDVAAIIDPEQKRHTKPIYIRMFKYRYQNFIYDVRTDAFVQVQFNTALPYEKILELAASSPPHRQFHLLLFCRNLIDIPIKNYFFLLIDEILHPFYIFQIISIMIWLADAYYIYAFAIFITSTISALISLVDTRRNLVKLASTAKYSCQVNRFNPSRGGAIDCESINSIELVPGDLIELNDHLTMPCDCVLIQGHVIVNEAMLTGESIPVTKIPLPNNVSQTYMIDNDRNHTLFAGTSVLQIRRGSSRALPTEKCVAMVLRTGFGSAKGKLILSILYPKPTTFKFYEDSFRFIIFMFTVGIIGIIISAIQLARLGVPFGDIIIRALDVITIAVPPALPLAMTVGTTFAIARLRRHHNIYCISPPRVNVSGQLKLMCFDKTGTLTEEGLDLMGIRPISIDKNTRKFGNGIKSNSIPTMYSNSIESRAGSVLMRTNLNEDEEIIRDFLYCMVSCHGLTHVRGEMVGDPLEMKIFESTKWILKEPENLDDSRLLTPQSDEDIVTSPVETNKPQYNRIALPPSIAPSSNMIDDDLEEETIQTVSNFSVQCDSDDEMSEPRVPPVVLATVKTFDFKSNLQRMSVIVRDIKHELSGGECDHVYDIFVKGSPEALCKISKPETIPYDFTHILNHYAHKGYRVLACAHRRITIPSTELSKLSREEIECNLDFLGLISMQNKIKNDTKPVIEDLNRNKIKSVMVTGDNPLTAVSVARQCSMIPKSRVFLGSVSEEGIMWKDINSNDTLDPNTLIPYDDIENPYELAVTGDVFAHLLASHIEKTANSQYIDTINPSPMHIVLSTSSVFARMTPDEKLKLVEEFTKLGYFVGMCGDGANDCGALKAAHVGISLSEAEASVAAPFTSLNPTIDCVPHVIKEGKAALATSFQMFKYMACYSLLQFFTVICLYQINSNLGDYQFLFVDIVIILPTVLLMSRTESNRKLVRSKPPSSLISRTVFASLAWHLLIAFVIAILVMINVQGQPFYHQLATAPNTKDNIATYETTALFSLNMFQTFSVAFAYSISKPFKKPLITNRIYVTVLIVTIIIISYIVLVPDATTRYVLQLVEMPIAYKVRIYIIGVLYLIVTYLFERFVVLGLLRFVLNVFSIHKLAYYYSRYIKRETNPSVAKSRKLYNLLIDSIQRLRQEENSKRNDCITLVLNDLA